MTRSLAICSLIVIGTTAAVVLVFSEVLIEKLDRPRARSVEELSEDLDQDLTDRDWLSSSGDGGVVRMQAVGG